MAGSTSPMSSSSSGGPSSAPAAATASSAIATAAAAASTAGGGGAIDRSAVEAPNRTPTTLTIRCSSSIVSIFWISRVYSGCAPWMATDAPVECLGTASEPAPGPAAGATASARRSAQRSSTAAAAACVRPNFSPSSALYLPRPSSPSWP